MQTARARSWFSYLLLGLIGSLAGACDTDAQHHPPSGGDAGRLPPDGPAPSSQPVEAPRLCASCQPYDSGGDTSDLGGGTAIDCKGFPEIEMISLEDASGLELEQPPLLETLSALEGRYEAPVRWQHRPTDTTTLVVRVERTGRARLSRYTPVPADSPWRQDQDFFSCLPECPGPTAAPEVELTLSTEDGTVAGISTAILGLPIDRESARPPSYRGPLWTNAVPWASFRGGGSGLRGSLEFDDTAPDAGTTELQITGSVLRGDDGDRAELRVVLLLHTSFRTEHAIEELQSFNAVPLDGCPAAQPPNDGGGCTWLAPAAVAEADGGATCE